MRPTTPYRMNLRGTTGTAGSLSVIEVTGAGHGSMGNYARDGAHNPPSRDEGRRMAAEARPKVKEMSPSSAVRNQGWD